MLDGLGWRSICQLFWCDQVARVLTRPHKDISQMHPKGTQCFRCPKIGVFLWNVASLQRSLEEPKLPGGGQSVETVTSHRLHRRDGWGPVGSVWCEPQKMQMPLGLEQCLFNRALGMLQLAWIWTTDGLIVVQFCCFFFSPFCLDAPLFFCFWYRLGIFCCLFALLLFCFFVSLLLCFSAFPLFCFFSSLLF